MKQRSSAGFSLIEVALALGVISFAVLAVYGLLVGGLQMAREARTNLRMAEILTSACTDLRTWERLTNGAVSTPQYQMQTGYDTNTRTFSATSSSVTVYRDGSTNSISAIEPLLVATSLVPINGGQAARVTVGVAAGPTASLVGNGVVFTNNSAASYTTMVLNPPTP